MRSYGTSFDIYAVVRETAKSNICHGYLYGWEMHQWSSRKDKSKAIGRYFTLDGAKSASATAKAINAKYDELEAPLFTKIRSIAKERAAELDRHFSAGDNE